MFSPDKTEALFYGHRLSPTVKNVPEPTPYEIIEILTSASESVRPFASEFAQKVASQAYGGKIELEVEGKLHIENQDNP